jgi:hypothetical protein
VHCRVWSMTKKRGPRKPETIESRLRIRLAVRTLEIWKELGYPDSLRGFAIRAAARLETERKASKLRQGIAEPQPASSDTEAEP